MGEEEEEREGGRGVGVLAPRGPGVSQRRGRRKNGQMEEGFQSGLHRIPNHSRFLGVRALNGPRG